MKISVPFRLACFLCMLVLVLVSATNGQPPSESAKKPSATVGDDSDAEKSADDPQPIDLALVEKTTKAFDAKLDECNLLREHDGTTDHWHHRDIIRPQHDDGHHRGHLTNSEQEEYLTDWEWM